MNLTAADISALPLPIALLDRDGAVVAHSPEWTDGDAATTYALGDGRLVVADERPDADVSIVVGRLLDELQAAACATSGTISRRLRLLGTALALVAGALSMRPAPTSEVIADLLASLELYTTFPIEIGRDEPGIVPDAGAAAWALHQIVRNARAHDDATAVTLRVEVGPAFTVEWAGTPVPTGIGTARHQADRAHWGLGYVRLAADALGAVFLAPARCAPGRLQAVFALEPAARLGLPLAAVDASGRVERSSPGWDEENLIPDGRTLTPRLRDLVGEARRAPGAIARARTHRARATDRRTWIAVAPQATPDRARDVVRGLRHGPELLEMPPPQRTAVRALAYLIDAMLGEPLPRSSAAWFDAQHGQACAALGVRPFVGPYPVAAAPEPCVAAYLCAALDACLCVDGDSTVAVVPARRRDDPLVRRLGDSAGMIRFAAPAS